MLLVLSDDAESVAKTTVALKSHWDGVDGSDAQNNQTVPNSTAPGLVWKLVTLLFFVVRGGFGLLSTIVGFGMWVAGGALSLSLNVIGWGLGQGQGNGNQNVPLVSLLFGATEAISFIAEFEREYGEFHPAFQRAGFMESLQISREEYKLLLQTLEECVDALGGMLASVQPWSRLEFGNMKSPTNYGDNLGRGARVSSQGQMEGATRDIFVLRRTKTLPALYM
ncbi:hypothetical protein SUGI_0886210 [Cryptomeria japonica]|nr:hypothetical protein SUGI_0886210 [Cryptomeria japonica]